MSGEAAASPDIYQTSQYHETNIIYHFGHYFMPCSTGAEYKDIQKLPQPLRDSILIDVANKAIDKYSIKYLQPGRIPGIKDIGIAKRGIAEKRDWLFY